MIQPVDQSPISSRTDCLAVALTWLNSLERGPSETALTITMNYFSVRRNSSIIKLEVGSIKEGNIQTWRAWFGAMWGIDICCGSVHYMWDEREIDRYIEDDNWNSNFFTKYQLLVLECWIFCSGIWMATTIYLCTWPAQICVQICLSFRLHTDVIFIQIYSQECSLTTISPIWVLDKQTLILQRDRDRERDGNQAWSKVGLI